MHLPHDDMYYDRTWFDELGAWLLQICRRYMPRSRGQLWSTGFSLFSGLCVAWAAGLATHCVVFDVTLNECLAQMLAAMLLLAAARHFLAATGMSATSALPRNKLISRTDVAPQQVVRAQVQTTNVAIPSSVPVQSSRQSSHGILQPAADARKFFHDVKKAGINVRIARTLYSAGFRSGNQVRDCEDSRLLEIDGIGQATLRKLRLQFGLTKNVAKPQSNAA